MWQSPAYPAVAKEMCFWKVEKQSHETSGILSLYAAEKHCVKCMQWYVDKYNVDTRATSCKLNARGWAERSGGALPLTIDEFLQSLNLWVWMSEYVRSFWWYEKNEKHVRFRPCGEMRTKEFIALPALICPWLDALLSLGSWIVVVLHSLESTCGGSVCIFVVAVWPCFHWHGGFLRSLSAHCWKCKAQQNLWRTHSALLFAIFAGFNCADLDIR